MDELTWNCVKGIQAQLDMASGQIESKLGDTATYTMEHLYLTAQLEALHGAMKQLSAYKSARARFERLQRGAK